MVDAEITRAASLTKENEDDQHLAQIPDRLDFGGGELDIQNRGPKHFEIAGDDHVLTISGSNFDYDKSVPVSGKVEQLTFETEGGSTLLTIKQIGISVDDVIDAIQTQDFDAILSKPLTLKGSAGGDLFVSGKGADELFGLNGNDSLDGAGGKDTLSGGSGNDRLLGGSGNDKVSGAIGNDYLGGGSGSDKLSGAQGNDILEGGAGKDKMDGGSGSDTFVFSSAAEANGDTILDFNRKAGGDFIDLRSFDADSITAGIQAFTFIGDDGFSGAAGELRASGKSIFGDIDGDGQADFTINMNKLDASKLDADNFLLG